VYVVVLDRGVSKEGIYHIYITNDDEYYTRMEWNGSPSRWVQRESALDYRVPSPIDRFVPIRSRKSSRNIPTSRYWIFNLEIGTGRSR
jgi:hypothetical protein